ncbi:hypothetical protein [Microbacterium lacticum]|uniref:Uncharacterized protein n=1 Tax=Microbacterium lacticum TaxID=33885 RepID=A0A4Y3UNA1_9MICO|nr:hypothetical protein [Microbacterium lacticum]TQN00444.1 hypothetical protein FHX68_0538 [Microbacterium lacticum]GEB94395.1 hypothetical protein MLA01_06140 [Microbacterium lacticum]GGN17869.1 hypothetical protein GCM10009724_09560 [Microbacterium lacticum]
MTDGRIPGKWIAEPRFAEMSVDAWCVFTKAIAWSNEAGTDGVVKRRYLSQFHPSGETQPAAYKELADLGLWAPTPDGYAFKDWAKKAHLGGLGQSTAAQVQKNRNASKATSKAYRERAKGDQSRDTVTPAGHVGQDRTGQAEYGSTVLDDDLGNVNAQTGEVLDAMPVTSWPVAEIPGAKSCVVCGQQVSGQLDQWGLCSKVSEPHREARKRVAA